MRVGNPGVMFPQDVEIAVAVLPNRPGCLLVTHVRVLRTHCREAAAHGALVFDIQGPKMPVEQVALFQETVMLGLYGGTATFEVAPVRA